MSDQFFLIIIFDATVAPRDGTGLYEESRGIHSGLLLRAEKNVGTAAEDMIDDDFGRLLAEELDGAFRD